jgi:hypothetical protein
LSFPSEFPSHKRDDRHDKHDRPQQVYGETDEFEDGSEHQQGADYDQKDDYVFSIEHGFLLVFTVIKE